MLSTSKTRFLLSPSPETTRKLGSRSTSQPNKPNSLVLGLVELKVVPFQTRFIDQVLDYRADLHKYQQEARLVEADIEPYILVTSASEAQKEAASRQSISCTVYDARDVLKYFYEHFKPVATYAEAKPIDIGIWNLHLIHGLLYKTQDIGQVAALRQALGGSPRTLYSSCCGSIF